MGMRCLLLVLAALGTASGLVASGFMTQHRAKRANFMRTACRCMAEDSEPAQNFKADTEKPAPESLRSQQVELVERAGDPFRGIRVVLYAVFGVAGLAGIVTSFISMGSDTGMPAAKLVLHG